MESGSKRPIMKPECGKLIILMPKSSFLGSNPKIKTLNLSPTIERKGLGKNAAELLCL